MSKTKGLALLILGATLSLFAYQNWNYPAPPIHFLIFTFPPLPHSLIVYSCLLIGFVAGWVAHLLRSRRLKKQEPASSSASS